MPDTTLDLVDGFDWHNARVMQLQVAQPTGGLYSKFGEPRILVHNPDGSAYYVDQVPVIRQYMESLVRHEGGADILPLLSLADSMVLKRAIVDFFTDAAARAAARKPTP